MEKRSWIIPKTQIHRMWNILEDTHDMDMEFGAILCKDKSSNEISVTSVCDGDKCAVTIKPQDKCGTLEFVGTYHTHRSFDEVKPSVSDIYAHLSEKEKISCIGGDHQIKCYISKNENKFKSEHQEEPLRRMFKLEQKLVQSGKATWDEYEMLNNYIDYYLDNYFDVIELTKKKK